MKIAIEWFVGANPQFNVSLSSGEGKEPFIVIKGCRLVNGSKGEFVSWPATKNQNTGKFWNHVWASEAFNEAVKAEAIKANRPTQRPKDERYRAGMPDDSEPPF
jgi:DNA-binding cell septation regulator SpoVG